MNKEKDTTPMEPIEVMATTLFAVYEPLFTNAREARKKIREYRESKNPKLAEIRKRILVAQDELDKRQNSYWRISKPRRLRRILRRLKKSLHKI